MHNGALDALPRCDLLAENLVGIFRRPEWRSLATPQGVKAYEAGQSSDDVTFPQRRLGDEDGD